LKGRYFNYTESFTIDELIDQLIFIEKVEEGLKQSENGQVISNEEASKIIDKTVKIVWTAVSLYDLHDILNLKDVTCTSIPNHF
jgi:hypothetical protein